MAYPATVRFNHQKKSSRLWALFTIIPVKFVLLVPIILLLYGVSVGAMLFGFLGIFAVLVNGKYPKYFEDVFVKCMRLQWRLNAFAFCLTDKYPPFSLEAGSYPAELSFKHERKSSQLWALLTLIPVKLVLIIPHLVVLLFLEIVAFVVMILGVFAVLFTGKYPKPFERVVVAFYRYGFRVAAYMFCLTDKYPPIGWGA